MYVAFQPTRFIPPNSCLSEPCALTAHFHPYPDTSIRAVIFCDTICLLIRKLASHPLDGVVLYVVRTFLIPDTCVGTAIERSAVFFSMNIILYVKIMKTKVAKKIIWKYTSKRSFSIHLYIIFLNWQLVLFG